MIILVVIALLIIGGMISWAAANIGAAWPRWSALAALASALAATVLSVHGIGSAGAWLSEFRMDWIRSIGVSLHFGMDGLSLLLVLLTLLLGIISVLCSWTEINDRVGFFHFNLLASLAGIVGVFTALDMFLFYFFWELMLIPMYFLISIWGHENRVYASYKFFIFTQAGGLLMLLSILALYFIHGRGTGVYTFDYTALLSTPIPPKLGMWLMLGFFAAFAVKLPAVPFHTWLPDAHTEAPTAGSVVLAGLLLKTGAYGLLRFVLPLFPDTSAEFAPLGMALGVIGIIYGALLAFAQNDIKRLIAYTSISHLGFVLLGVYAGNGAGLQGAVMQMLAHGLSTGALFIIAGMLQARLHTRDIERMSGLWASAPRMAGFALFFSLASLGLPGLANFVAEILVLIGGYSASVPLTAIASFGLVAATIYSLWLVQRVFHGKPAYLIPDLSFREALSMLCLMLPLIWLGLFPHTAFDLSSGAVGRLMHADSYLHATNSEARP